MSLDPNSTATGMVQTSVGLFTTNHLDRTVDYLLPNAQHLLYDSNSLGGHSSLQSRVQSHPLIDSTDPFW
jgi:hypothetical protein